MVPEGWEQVERLYQAAVELSEDRRAAFINDSCGNDESLRREVQSLLARERGAALFLEKPALEAAGKATRALGDSPKTTDDALGLIGETLSPNC
jgi:hypothetical protein